MLGAMSQNKSTIGPPTTIRLTIDKRNPSDWKYTWDEAPYKGVDGPTQSDLKWEQPKGGSTDAGLQEYSYHTKRSEQSRQSTSSNGGSDRKSH